jgi:hypothetical protein
MIINWFDVYTNVSRYKVNVMMDNTIFWQNASFQVKFGTIEQVNVYVTVDSIFVSCRLSYLVDI